jgi:hypothetical protein
VTAPQRGSLAELWRETIGYSNATDSLMDHLERRVAAAEEVAAARWPRRWVLAARLRRSLRASVAPYLEREDVQGFEDARLESTTATWLLETRPDRPR